MVCWRRPLDGAAREEEAVDARFRSWCRRAWPLVALVSLAAVLGACASAAPASPAAYAPAEAPPPGVDVETHAALRAAVLSPDRPAEERARDGARHPIETLEFFGIRRDMRVVELWAGGGWYSVILAPLLREQGRYIATNFDPNGPESGYTNLGRAFDQRVKSTPAIFAKAEVHFMHPPDDFALGPDGAADLVLTFRNFHNWLRDGVAERIVEASFRALRPGGVFGVVEHRARPDADPKTVWKTGYVPEAFVVRMCEAAGFKLWSSSEVNANPKDTKNWPGGVWTLPPTLAMGEVDRAKYVAIGESDRMTLRFVRPAAPRADGSTGGNL
jgi:predicted methyltransferase